MAYPCLQDHPPKAEQLRLTEQDRQLLQRIRFDSARLGCAVLLKATEYLGYPPRQDQVDRRTVEMVAVQLGLDPELFRRYKWKSRLWDKHLALVANNQVARCSMPRKVLEKCGIRRMRKGIRTGFVETVEPARMQTKSEKTLLEPIPSKRLKRQVLTPERF